MKVNPDWNLLDSKRVMFLRKKNYDNMQASIRVIRPFLPFIYSDLIGKY